MWKFLNNSCISRKRDGKILKKLMQRNCKDLSQENGCDTEDICCYWKTKEKSVHNFVQRCVCFHSTTNAKKNMGIFKTIKHVHFEQNQDNTQQNTTGICWINTQLFEVGLVNVYHLPFFCGFEEIRLLVYVANSVMSYGNILCRLTSPFQL